MKYFVHNSPELQAEYLPLDRSMDLGDVIDAKLSMQYDSGVAESKSKRSLKRKEKFATQVKRAVNDMQVK